jgi:hypothetical protein
MLMGLGDFDALGVFSFQIGVACKEKQQENRGLCV